MGVEARDMYGNVWKVNEKGEFIPIRIRRKNTSVKLEAFLLVGIIIFIFIALGI